MLLVSFLYPETNWRFVEQAYSGLEQLGTFHKPFKDFTAGEADVPGGGTLWVQPAGYSAVGTYTKAMTVRAPLGNVVLGN